MNKTEIVNKIRLTANRTGLKLKKHSPEILIAVGVVGTIASTVMACRATTKIDTILDGTRKKVDRIHDSVEKGYIENVETHETVDYSQEDSKKDLTIVYTQTALKFAKLYAPAVLLGGFSMACFITSNNIMRKRFIAVSAAYAVVDKTFKEYRERVVERFGDDVDRELRYNIKAETLEETTVDKDGNEITTEKTVKKCDPNALGECARIFDEYNVNWKKDAESNLFFLRSHQSFLNDRLITNGHLFLNEAYETLGFPQTPAGQLLGWIYKPDDPKHEGDNYVDFGLYDGDKERVNAFVNGEERSVILNFNVDGVVYDLI